MKIKDGFDGERSIVVPELIIRMMEEDPLTSILHITDMGYYPNASHHYRERRDPVDQYIFIYCIDGSGWYELNGRRTTVRGNQYFILPADTPHAYAASETDPWTIYWIHFRGPLARHYAVHAASPQTVAPSMTSRIHLRHELFEEIFAALNSSFTIESLRYAMAAFHHYLASLLYIKVYRITGGKTMGEDVVEATIHFLVENIERHLTLAEIANYSGFSPSRLSAVFKERTGHSPLNYFNLLKVREACRLLETTDMKLNQISYKLGMSDPFYFSRMFSKIMGMSPKAYRTREKA